MKKIAKKYSDEVDIDKAIEEVRKKGHLDISIEVRLDTNWDEEAFIQEFAGVLASARQILEAYYKKYGREKKRYAL